MNEEERRRKKIERKEREKIRGKSGGGRKLGEKWSLGGGGGGVEPGTSSLEDYFHQHAIVFQPFFVW